MLGYGSTNTVGHMQSALPSGQGGVNLGGEAVAVSAGQYHTLVAMADGKAFAFGNGANGRLGSGATDNIGDTAQTLPHLMGPVLLNGSAVAVAAGDAHSLVLMDDGSLWAFGRGDNGRLGYGTVFDVGGAPFKVPSKQGPVPLGGNAMAVAAGSAHSLVVLGNGSVLAFGIGSMGRLGYGDTSDVGITPSTLPSKQGPVPLGGNATAVAAGADHSMVLLDDGSVLAFGTGANGRLGYGDTSDVGDTLGTLPSDQGAVSLGGKAVAVAGGTAHSLVMLEDGTARAFGIGTLGRLGYGDTSDVGNAPETVPSKKGPVPLPADDAGVSVFVVIGAVAGAALLIGGAAWAMKQVGLAHWTGGSAPSASGPASAGATAVQQTGSGETAAVGGASGLSSIGVHSPASGSRA
ncbi:hypothetical protein FNF29_07162 [Cafeteria roenbergensis]|uniref:RCC1-like domain-containing protein n=1 Tax=Cafeteria roenbergensis TaxID=33653 RepID=A0A5A8C4A8_CAFRO|nr:hypothetical protein FNF29_07162 [Cafeteria roenbergensis]|eukprot:KAA0147708.1 hypothetical protein FNF29_07162 [Cafeteria roenbergensis]